MNTATHAPSSMSVLCSYRARLSASPELDAEAEYALVEACQREGCAESRARLVEANLHVVLGAVRTYSARHIAEEDQLQEAVVGLLQAIEKFDTTRGNRLATYARYWVRARVLKQLMTGYRVVRLGTTVNQRRLFFRLNKERSALEAEGVEPTAERLAERLEVSPEEVREMELRMSTPATRLDAPVGGEDGARTLLDVFADNQSPDAETLAEHRELLEHLRGEIEALRAGLSQRKMEILELRVLSEEPWSLARLGERFGVSRERARQLEADLLETLRLRFARRIGEHRLLRA